MKNRITIAALSCIVLACLQTPVLAQDKSTPIKALQPAVPTAEWAKTYWMPRHEQKLKEKAERRQVDLVMIGDSITHGWETRGKTVWDKFYAPRNALNLGFSGDRTEQVLWRLEHGEVDGIAPKLAVIMIGTNNTGHRQDPAEQTAAGIEAIVNQLRTRLPKTKILLLAVFPRGEQRSDELRKLNDGINKIIRSFADNEHIFYLDLGSSFLQEDGSLPKSIMPDLLHLNEEGYRIWAEVMEPTLKKLLN